MTFQGGCGFSLWGFDFDEVVLSTVDECTTCEGAEGVDNIGVGVFAHLDPAVEVAVEA